MDHLPEEFDHLILQSDSRWFSNTSWQKQKYNNSCNQCFGKIEQARRLFEVIPTPDHWIDIIKSAKKQSGFNVTKIVTANFVSSKNLETLITYQSKGGFEKREN